MRILRPIISKRGLRKSTGTHLSHWILNNAGYKWHSSDYKCNSYAGETDIQFA